jgi:hypothetical protein
MVFSGGSFACELELGRFNVTSFELSIFPKGEFVSIFSRGEFFSG